MGLGRDLQGVLGAACEDHDVPGAASALIVDDEAHVAVRGVTSAEHPAPIVPATLFQVASISKTFTSAAVGLLVQTGEVAFEDPVAKHLPGIAERTGLDLDAITVEHLLSHQAGFDGDHLFVGRVADAHTPLQSGLDALRTSRRLFEPGEGYSYNNAAFSMAGAVVEVVSGRSFESFVRERLLDPLGMASASFTADEAITHPVALPHWVFDGTPHVIRGAGWQPGWQLGPLDWPAGGLVLSIEHLVAWARLQWTGCAPDGTRIIGDEVLQRLHAPVTEVTCVEQGGLDWERHTADGVGVIGHGGVTAGYVSHFAVVPGHRAAVITLTNATNGASVHQAVRRWGLQHAIGISLTDPVPDPSLGVDLARLEGRYEHAFGMVDVTRGEAEGTVLLSQSPRKVDGWQPPLDAPTTFAPCAPADLVSLDAAGPARVVRFDPEAGRAAWLLSSGRRAPRVG